MVGRSSDNRDVILKGAVDKGSLASKKLAAAKADAARRSLLRHLTSCVRFIPDSELAAESGVGPSV